MTDFIRQCCQGRLFIIAAAVHEKQIKRNLYISIYLCMSGSWNGSLLQFISHPTSFIATTYFFHLAFVVKALVELGFRSPYRRVVEQAIHSKTIDLKTNASLSFQLFAM